MAVKTNRSDVDRLGDIRAEIRRLEAEEVILRDRILEAGKDKVTGDDFVAVVDHRERRGLDTKAILAWYGEQELGRFMRVTEFTVVTTKAKTRADA
jgi:hypothetical protein